MEVQNPTDANVWYRAQVIAEGNHHICKIKKADDPTDFSKIKPVIEADIVGTGLTHGTINAMCYGYVDNIIVYVGEPTPSAIDPASKSATTWGYIKGQ